MANLILWDAAPTSRGNVLSTELDALANGSRTNAGTEIANQTNLDTYGVLELNVTFGVAPSANGVVTLYLVTAPGGTNYSSGSSTVDPGPDQALLTMKLVATTNAQRKVSKPFLIPPTKCKFILENNSGQAFPANGSTVILYTFNEEIQ